MAHSFRFPVVRCFRPGKIVVVQFKLLFFETCYVFGFLPRTILTDFRFHYYFVLTLNFDYLAHLLWLHLCLPTTVAFFIKKSHSRILYAKICLFPILAKEEKGCVDHVNCDGIVSFYYSHSVWGLWSYIFSRVGLEYYVNHYHQ